MPFTNVYFSNYNRTFLKPPYWREITNNVWNKTMLRYSLTLSLLITTHSHNLARYITIDKHNLSRTKGSTRHLWRQEGTSFGGRAESKTGRLPPRLIKPKARTRWQDPRRPGPSNPDWFTTDGCNSADLRSDKSLRETPDTTYVTGERLPPRSSRGRLVDIYRKASACNGKSSVQVWKTV